MRRFLVLLAGATAGASAMAGSTAGAFPRALNDYGDASGAGVLDTLLARAHAEPFNVAATAIFLLAIVHTFFAAKLRHWAHVVEENHRRRLAARERPEITDADADGAADEVSFPGQILHFLGEVEAVFGLWVLALVGAITWFKGWGTAVHYVSETVVYTEPMFVVIVMTLASTRPVLQLAEQLLRGVAALGRGSPAAWWCAILVVAPILGSFITEPAAMTIGALLLARQFYELQPGARLKYATLGLLFVNVSVGGTLTHFAAPPVLMVASVWKWDLAHMFLHFGKEACIGIVLSTGLYFAIFRRELLSLQKRPAGAADAKPAREPVPAWIAAVHLLFLGFTVWQAHHPALFIGGFLFFLAFAQATAHHQDRVDLRPALLVGFFLAGLVNHGGVQAWWIEPVLKSLGEVPLMLGATVLTAFNDNAAITYLATLVPGFTDELKHAVVVGAVTGGGLTVIANAPNPAGQAILARYFPDGVSPLWLFVGALVPTAIVGLCFMLL